ncbi:hypothetical protein Tsubulata_027758 [Turnera subulata]|uniref:SNF2 N-terminal domain-containing protein n=1 Tax=Turnera subulata TaxID=218843 RepID=A0A9Q0GAR1_9ROSI|nr:hypothetical protein Tsubulata_027758 [Turnera subulata]
MAVVRERRQLNLRCPLMELSERRPRFPLPLPPSSTAPPSAAIETILRSSSPPPPSTPPSATPTSTSPSPATPSTSSPAPRPPSCSPSQAPSPAPTSSPPPPAISSPWSAAPTTASSSAARTTVSLWGCHRWPHSRIETYMVGFVLANIVGLKYYSGRITGRELVGHIERSVAAVLSPLIDSHRVTVEGIVPNFGAKNKFRTSCQVHLFVRLEDFEVVRSAISGAGMVLLPPLHSPLGSFDAMVVRERSKERDGVKILDEVFKLADERARKEGQMGHLEPQTEVIKSPLFPHQKEALWWLVNRENSTELPPFREERDGEYVNVLTNFHTDKHPEPLCGGILADDMGLGKTLTLLSLIALDKCGGNTGWEFMWSGTLLIIH